MPFGGRKDRGTGALTADAKAADTVAVFRGNGESFTKRETAAEEDTGIDANKRSNWQQKVNELARKPPPRQRPPQQRPKNPFQPM